MSHHLQHKRKIIMDFIANQLQKAGDKDIDSRKLENMVMWNYGTTRAKAQELMELVMEIMQ